MEKGNHIQKHSNCLQNSFLPSEDTNNDLFDDFISSNNTLKTWKCNIICSGYTSPDQALPNERDICLYLNTTGDTFGTIHSDFCFDHCFTGPDKFEEMKKYLINCCRKAGFYATATKNSRKVIKSKDSSLQKRLAILEIACKYHTIVQSNNKKPSTKNAKTQRVHHTRTCCDEGESCPFLFKVICNAKDNLWYLMANASEEDRSTHKGHFYEDSTLTYATISQLDTKDIKLAKKLSNSGGSTTAIAEVINATYEGTSLQWSPQQIAYVLQREELQNLLHGNDASSAERLLTKFNDEVDKGDGFDYVALIEDKDSEWKIRLPKGRPATKFSNKENRSLSRTEIQSSMRVNNNQEVLIAIAWITGTERKMIQKFPYLLFLDVTEKTNNEKRPMFVGTSLDGNNNTFICLHSFMPNNRLTTFDWIYSRAMPLLWGKDIMNRVKVVITDGESALYTPIDMRSRPKHSQGFKNLCVYRCTFHLFTQEFQKLQSPEDEEGKCVWKVCKSWIDSLITTVLHTFQYEDSLNKLKKFMKDNKDALPAYSKLKDLLEGMHSIAPRWANCQKEPKLDLLHTTTSPGEASNSSMKRFVNDPLAGKSIVKAASILLEHTEARDKKRSSKNLMQLNKNLKTTTVIEQNFITVYAQKFYNQNVRKYVSDYMWCEFQSTRSFLVCHTATFNKPDIDKLNKSDKKYQLKMMKSKYIPQYSDICHIVFEKDLSMIKCLTCKRYERKGIPTTCMVAVLGLDRVHAKMFHPMYLKAFNADLQNKSVEISDVVQQMFNRHENGKSSEGWCDISNLLSDGDLTDLIQTKSVKCEITKKKMIALYKMQQDDEPLMRGEIIPEKYFIYEDMEDQKISELIIAKPKMNTEIDVDDFNLQEDEEDVGMTLLDDTDLYSHLRSSIAEITRMCEKNKVLNEIARKGIDELVSNVKKEYHKIYPQSNRASMVSYNAESEQAPMRKRYRSFYER